MRWVAVTKLAGNVTAVALLLLVAMSTATGSATSVASTRGASVVLSVKKTTEGAGPEADVLITADGSYQTAPSVIDVYVHNVAYGSSSCPATDRAESTQVQEQLDKHGNDVAANLVQDEVGTDGAGTFSEQGYFGVGSPAGAYVACAYLSALSSDGAASAVADATASARFSLGSASNPHPAKPAKRVTTHLTVVAHNRAPRPGQYVNVQVTVHPTARGRDVDLEVLATTGWMLVEDHHTNARGETTFEISFTHAGVYHVRVRAAATAGATAAAALLTFKIPQSSANGSTGSTTMGHPTKVPLTVGQEVSAVVLLSRPPPPQPRSTPAVRTRWQTAARVSRGRPGAESGLPPCRPG